MLRNLLYSIGIHIIFILAIVINMKMINLKDISLKPIQFDDSFVLDNLIMTKKSQFSFLTLEDKVKLYTHLLDQQNDIKNKDLKEISKSSIGTYNFDKDSELINKILKTQNKDKIYLGPTDYKKLISKQNLAAKKNINTTISNTDQKIQNLILNADIEKIFTKKDVKNLKQIVKDEQITLTNIEKSFIQKQLRNCYKQATIKNGRNSQIAISVMLKINKNGSFDKKKVDIKIIDNQNKYSEKDYQIAKENVKLAIVLCDPLTNLPAIKYESWKVINFIFNGKK